MTARPIEILVENPAGRCKGVARIVLDGADIDPKAPIALVKDNGTHQVKVTLGAPHAGRTRTLSIDPRAGTLAPPADIIDIAKLTRAFFDRKPDVSMPEQRVLFGTSGHRGSAFDTTFNENHIAAITQAICRYRASQGIDGPLYVGRDTHALSEPAFQVALEVLAANGVAVLVDAAGGFTPTPVISHAILTYNKGRTRGLADGIVITPSHNPPKDGGFKYNPPEGEAPPPPPPPAGSRTWPTSFWRTGWPV